MFKYFIMFTILLVFLQSTFAQSNKNLFKEDAADFAVYIYDNVQFLYQADNNKITVQSFPRVSENTPSNLNENQKSEEVTTQASTNANPTNIILKTLTFGIELMKVAVDYDNTTVYAYCKLKNDTNEITFPIRIVLGLLPRRICKVIFKKVEVIYKEPTEIIPSDSNLEEKPAETNGKNSSRRIPSANDLVGINTGPNDFIIEAVRNDIEKKVFKLLSNSKKNYEKCSFLHPDV